MKEAYINHLSFALGDRVATVEESAESGRTLSRAASLREAGFRRHHLCDSKSTAYDLARRSVEEIKKELGEVGAIIYSTCIPSNGNVGEEKKFRESRDVKYLMDFAGSHLQSDFGLEKAMVIGLTQQACTGMLGALRIAKMLLATEREIQRVLCVTADRFPEGALYEQAYNLISDGAAACVVSDAPEGFRMLAGHGITNGAMALASDDETVGSYFGYSHRIIQETLAKAGLQLSDIAWIVPQNTNIKASQILSRLLKFDHERFYYPTIEEVGHMISGDNIVNLRRLVEEGKVRPGERVLLFMAGYGLNWQCVILEKR